MNWLGYLSAVESVAILFLIVLLGRVALRSAQWRERALRAEAMQTMARATDGYAAGARTFTVKHQDFWIC